MNFLYLSIETTGLFPEQHDITEVAWALEGMSIERFIPEHTIADADPVALSTYNYHARRLGDQTEWVRWEDELPKKLQKELEDATIVSCNPSFEASFLRMQLEPVWHHQLFDVSLYAAGLFGWETSRGLKKTIEFVNKLGYTVPIPRHTAIDHVLSITWLHEVLRKIAILRDQLSVEDIAIAVRTKQQYREYQSAVLSTVPYADDTDV